MSDYSHEIEALKSELSALREENKRLENKVNEVTKLYRDTLAHANGITAMPEMLGRRKIVKAFIKLFVPNFVLNFGRKVLGKLRQKKTSSSYDAWIKNSAEHVKECKKLDYEPLISILVPLYNTDKALLCEMIESCLNQSYKNIELCLADASDDKHGYVFDTAKQYADKDSRVKLEKLKENLGISGNTNKCRQLANGEYITLLDHDDLLIEHAIYSMAKAINEQKADVIYSDEDHVRNGKRITPFFKPDFNRDLLYSQMYICHLLCFKAELFDKVGGLDDKFSGSQDYDLMLKLTEQTDNIYHIQDILYSWREVETSTSVNPGSKPYAHDAGKGALDAHLKRRYGDIAHAEDSDYLFVFDARFDTLKNNPLVSIIIPTKDHTDLLEACVNSILEKSSYTNYEIIILDNNSEQAESFAAFERLQAKDARVKVIDAFFEFNWSKLNNYGIKNSNGEVYIFLNNDTEIITPDWIERLAENALREDVGVVGGLLLFDDNTIQHAGVVIGMGGWADHVYAGMNQIHAADKFVSPMVNRNVLAVTGACMAIAKKTIDKIGMFD
ncbi:MAG: glycosyltransferase, partial [Clostridia bacterium]|nr:glycosyltransferase [Clostridia bacterium]